MSTLLFYFPHVALFIRRLVHGSLKFIPGLLLLTCGHLQAQLNFSAITQAITQLYGPQSPDATRRLQQWRDLISAESNASVEEKLNAVNDFFNTQLSFHDDIEIWGQEDYWATPIEALIKGMADCEDYAIAKYITLRELNIPAEQLRITYVKALRLNEAHMVLAWYEHPDGIPMILDNLQRTISPATQRNDLLPVYSFNNNGLWLPGAGHDKRVGDNKQLSRWQDVLGKMRAEGLPEDL